MRERDLFRAIVLSSTAIVGVAACTSTPAAVDAGRDAPITPEVDTGPVVADTGTDAPVLVADSGSPVDGSVADAGSEDAGEDAMVLII